jgi:hypothetical protein
MHDIHINRRPLPHMSTTGHRCSSSSTTAPSRSSSSADHYLSAPLHEVLCWRATGAPTHSIRFPSAPPSEGCSLVGRWSSYTRRSLELLSVRVHRPAPTGKLPNRPDLALPLARPAPYSSIAGRHRAHRPPPHTLRGEHNILTGSFSTWRIHRRRAQIGHADVFMDMIQRDLHQCYIRYRVHTPKKCYFRDFFVPLVKIFAPLFRD